MTTLTSCDSVRQHIEAYIDGELDAVSCDLVERHCEACSSCADIVRGLREAVGLCRDVGRSPVPRTISDHARTQVKRLLSASRIPSERQDEKP